MSAQEVNYDFGETNVIDKSGAAQGGHATPEEIVAIGKRMWQRILDAKVSPSDEAGTDSLLERIQNEFKDFNTSFPLVVRWAVQLHRFSHTALDKYLRMHASADLSTREAFLRLQAEYLVILYRESNTHRHDEKAVQQYRNQLVEQLIEEDKTFIELQKEAEAEAAAAAAKVDKDRRQALYEFLSKNVLSQKIKDGK